MANYVAGASFSCSRQQFTWGGFGHPHKLHQDLQTASPNKYILKVKINVLALPTKICCPQVKGSEGLTKNMTTHPLCTCQPSISLTAKSPSYQGLIIILFPNFACVFVLTEEWGWQ